MNIFELTIPRTEHPKKSKPPSLPSLSLRPSIHRFNIAIEKNAKPTYQKKTKINDLQESCDETKFHPIPFYSTTNEKRTIDPSPALSRRKFENSKRKKSIEKKKRFSCEFDFFACCTYYTYLVPTYYTYMRWFCPLSLSKDKNSKFFFCFFPDEKSDRRGKER